LGYRITDSFKNYLLQQIQESEKTRLAMGYSDKEGKLRKDSLMPFFKEPLEKWPTQIMSLVTTAPHVASAYEALGDDLAAQENYWLGTYAWVDSSTPFYSKKDDDLMTRRDWLVRLQLNAAICNDRISEKNRSRQLFEWVTRHRDVSEVEYEEWIERWIGSKRYHDVWGRKVERGYALACIERWREAFSEAESLLTWIEKDPHPRGDHAWEYYYWIFQSLKPVIEKKMGFESKKENLRKAFNPSIIQSGNHSRSHFLLFYLFHLRAKFAGLTGK
jgi:hypothetical protein